MTNAERQAAQIVGAEEHRLINDAFVEAVLKGGRTATEVGAAIRRAIQEFRAEPE